MITFDEINAIKAKLQDGSFVPEIDMAQSSRDRQFVDVFVDGHTIRLGEYNGTLISCDPYVHLDVIPVPEWFQRAIALAKDNDGTWKSAHVLRSEKRDLSTIRHDADRAPEGHDAAWLDVNKIY